MSTHSALFDQTYGEMLATGALGLVRDREIREAITGYYRIAYRLASVGEGARAAGSSAWQHRVEAAMGTFGRDWFDVEPALYQPAGRATLPSPEQVVRLVALVAPGTGWQDEARFARARVMTIEFELGALVAATESLVELLVNRDPALSAP